MCQQLSENVIQVYVTEKIKWKERIGVEEGWTIESTQAKIPAGPMETTNR